MSEKIEPALTLKLSEAAKWVAYMERVRFEAIAQKVLGDAAALLPPEEKPAP